MTFRFDDVCINADMELIQKMTDWLFEKFPKCEIMYGISPLVHRMDTGDPVQDQRIFPKILNAMSDHRIFYRVELSGVPKIDPRVRRAGHGLIHVDHRLLSKEVQELSILASCSLAGADAFIPPFNKWNMDTVSICEEHDIELIEFEYVSTNESEDIGKQWRSMEHNTYNKKQRHWYLHAREWTFEKFVAWFQNTK